MLSCPTGMAMSFAIPTRVGLVIPPQEEPAVSLGGPRTTAPPKLALVLNSRMRSAR